MATTTPARDLTAQPLTAAALLVSLPPLANPALDELLVNAREAFAGIPTVLATPDHSIAQDYPELLNHDLRLIPYQPQSSSGSSWTLTAADFLNAAELIRSQPQTASSAPPCILLLGPESQSLQPRSLRALAEEVLRGQCDLAVPRYQLPPRSSLITSSILYPVSRALFGTAPRFPLALDLCLSARMADRLAAAAQRFTAANQPDALLWPVAEAAVASFNIAQVDAGTRDIPQPSSGDLNSLLAQVVGSLFADVEAKAAFWQRTRVAPPYLPHTASAAAAHSTEDVGSMLEDFRLAYGNLVEIWSLVLPPQSLLGLKRLSLTPAEVFNMPESLWARIVYDFLLAYRLRTINRGHLLGAFTPLYLAWVASSILRGNSGINPEDQVETLAAAFVTEKPYLVSRWRWPDRFNP